MKRFFTIVLIFICFEFISCTTLPEASNSPLYARGSTVPLELENCSYAEIIARVNMYWFYIPVYTIETTVYCKIYRNKFTEIKVFNTRFDGKYSYQTYDDLLGPFEIKYIITAY